MSVIVVVVSTKITRSQDLGICVCYKHNKSVDTCEKLVSVRLPTLLHVLSAHVHNYNSGETVSR